MKNSHKKIDYAFETLNELAGADDSTINITEAKDTANKPDFSHVKVHKTKSKTLLTGSADLFVFNEPCSEIKAKPTSILTQIPTNFEDTHEDEKDIDNIFLKQQETEAPTHSTKITKNKPVFKKSEQVPSTEKPNNIIFITLLVLIVANVIFILQEINILDFKEMGAKFDTVDKNNQTTLIASKQANDLAQYSQIFSQN